MIPKGKIIAMTCPKDCPKKLPKVSVTNRHQLGDEITILNSKNNFGALLM